MQNMILSMQEPILVRVELLDFVRWDVFLVLMRSMILGMQEPVLIMELLLLLMKHCW